MHAMVRNKPEESERPLATSDPLERGISVVVPVHHSTVTLPALVQRIAAVLAVARYEVILVDDGSPSSTWNVIRTLADSEPEVVGLRLGRQSGQHNALVAGVRSAMFDIVVTMDDDLQNPPEEIPRLVAALEEEVDVVYGAPNRVAQKGWRRGSSFLARTLMASALGAENTDRMSSFRAFRTSLRNGFEVDLGPAVSLDALLSWSTSRFTAITVDHHERADGRSRYTFRRLLRFAIDTATGYSTVPLQLAMAIGLLTAVFGLGVLCWVIGRFLISGSSVPGFPFLASIIAIFAGVQLVTLGIIGEYLARMHFRVMHKPSYVVAERVGRRFPPA